MWSTVVLSTGLVLLLGCAVAVIFLLRKQCYQGFTSFGVLAISDSLLSALIGVVLIGLALFQEATIQNKTCNNTTILAETSTFLMSFIHSFISMLLMAMECWFSAKPQNSPTGNSNKKARQKKRLSLELVAQWVLPIASVIILHQLSPNNMLAKVKNQERSNDTCELVSLFSSGMPNECYEPPDSLEAHQADNNLTASVVQRIYALINGSADELRDSASANALPQPQTREEWKNMFMHLQMEPGQEYKRRGKRDDIPAPCNEDCEIHYRVLQTYFSGLTTMTYLVSMIGTVLLHRSTKNRSKHKKAESIEETQEPQAEELESKNVCHLKEVKMMALSNFVTWTPSIIEKVFKKWLCNSPPQWVVAIIFIVGQLSTVIRGLTNANSGHSDKQQNKNVIVPINASLDSHMKEISLKPTDQNVEVLFEKREKL